MKKYWINTSGKLRIIKIYKASFLVEIALGFIGLCSLVYYKPEDLASIITVSFLYCSAVASLVIGMKLVLASEKHIKLKEELNIVGHILNSIKLLMVLLLIFAGIDFFSTTIKVVDTINTRSIIYYSVMFALLIWSIVSIFNFFAYIVIAKNNKKIRFSELDNIDS